MTATLVAAPAPDDGDVLDQMLCSCGRLAAVVFEIDEEGDPWCIVRCECGSYAPPAADGTAS